MERLWDLSPEEDTQRQTMHACCLQSFCLSVVILLLFEITLCHFFLSLSCILLICIISHLFLSSVAFCGCFAFLYSRHICIIFVM